MEALVALFFVALPATFSVAFIADCLALLFLPLRFRILTIHLALAAIAATLGHALFAFARAVWFFPFFGGKNSNPIARTAAAATLMAAARQTHSSH